jgi:hypothetical protein
VPSHERQSPPLLRARQGRRAGALLARVLAVVRDLESVGSGNDLHLLRHAYIHLFTAPVCRIFEYVTGTPLARIVEKIGRICLFPPCRWTAHMFSLRACSPSRNWVRRSRFSRFTSTRPRTGCSKLPPEPPREIVEDAVVFLRERAADQGLELGAETHLPEWDGKVVDYDWAVGTMIGMG